MMLGGASLASLALADAPLAAPVPVTVALCYLTVRLVWPDGEPVVGARVTVTPLQSVFSGWIGVAMEDEALSDANGRASFTVTATTDYGYRIIAAFDGLRILDVEVQAPEGTASVDHVAQASQLH